MKVFMGPGMIILNLVPTSFECFLMSDPNNFNRKLELEETLSVYDYLIRYFYMSIYTYMYCVRSVYVF